MSKQTPYDNWDQQFNDLPLPDAEQSWQKMKEMLDEDERKKRVLPPFFMNCAVWSLALFLLLAGTWLLVRPEKWWEGKTTARKEQLSPSGRKENVGKPTNPDPSSQKSTVGGGVNAPIQEPGRSSSLETKTGQSTTTSESQPGNSSSMARATGRNNTRIEAKTPGARKQSFVSNSTRRNSRGLRSSVTGTARTETDPSKQKTASQPGTNPSVEQHKNLPVPTDQSPVGNQPAGPGKNRNDSAPLTEKQKDSTARKDSAAVPAIVKADKKASPSRKFIFSAGLGLQQQIPVNGQTGAPYNYYGRKNSLSDYIPSIYARMEKEKKWFMMGEFRYGAPQSLKGLSYSRQSKADTSFTHITTTTLSLRKTYYHQLPVSFNYYVLRNWSIGLGAMYSQFYGAVTEREIRNRNVQTNTEVVTKQIVQIKHFNDSFLYKTQAHLILQTDYQWRRFNLGVRYTRDLQPFIKFTQPSGKIEEEKNQTLQFILRFRLWKSK